MTAQALRSGIKFSCAIMTEKLNRRCVENANIFVPETLSVEAE